MAAKELHVQHRRPRQAQAGRRRPGRSGEGHPRPQGPECRHRQEVRLADRHQGRGHRRQGDRAVGPDREHGRPDGEGGRDQDLRSRRRRHHHRDRAGPGDLPRGPQERHRRAPTRWSSSAASRRPSRRWSRSSRSCRSRRAGKKEIAQVGTISANNDKEIGNLIADAMEKVGKDGVITVEEAKGLETTLETVDGMQFDRGYLSPYFVTDPEKMEAVLEDAYILIHDKKISSMKDLLPDPREGRRRAGSRSSSSPRTSRVRRSRRWWSTSSAARSRSRPSRRRASATAARRCSRDIAVLTGGKVISEEVGFKLENADPRPTSAGPSGSSSTRTTPRSSTARARRTTSRAGSTRSRPRSRRAPATTTGRSCRSGWPSSPAAWRSSTSGAATETEMKEKKARVEDALHATRAAVEEGIVPGGGVALLRAQSLARADRGHRRTRRSASRSSAARSRSRSG